MLATITLCNLADHEPEQCQQNPAAIHGIDGQDVEEEQCRIHVGDRFEELEQVGVIDLQSNRVGEEPDPDGQRDQ